MALARAVKAPQLTLLDVKQATLNEEQSEQVMVRYPLL